MGNENVIEEIVVAGIPYVPKSTIPKPNRNDPITIPRIRLGNLLTAFEEALARTGRSTGRIYKEGHIGVTYTPLDGNIIIHTRGIGHNLWQVFKKAA